MGLALEVLVAAVDTRRDLGLVVGVLDRKIEVLRKARGRKWGRDTLELFSFRLGGFLKGPFKLSLLFVSIIKVVFWPMLAGP